MVDLDREAATDQRAGPTVTTRAAEASSGVMRDFDRGLSKALVVLGSVLVLGSFSAALQRLMVSRLTVQAGRSLEWLSLNELSANTRVIGPQTPA